MCLAVPARVEEIRGEDPWTRSGKVDFGGPVKEVNLALVPEVRVGDWVLVHVGVAIQTIDEAEAQRVFAWLREMDELDLPAKGSP